MRDSGIELLRIICCFLVIGIHSMPLPDVFYSVGSNYGVIASSAVNSIVRPGLAVFFMISGYFLLNSKELTLKSHYIKRFSSIIIPFIFFGIIHVMISKKSISADSVIYFFKQSVDGATSIDVHFWYVYTILGLYAIAPLIRKAIINLTDRESLIGFLSLLSIMAYNLYFKEMHKINNDINYIIPIPDIGVSAISFISGGLIKKFHGIISTKKSIMLFFLGATITFTLYILSFNKYHFNTFASFGVGVILSASALLILFGGIKIKSRTIDLISKNTYGAFLIHLSLLRIIREYMPFTVFQYPVLYTISISIITLIISIIAALLINILIVDRVERIIMKRAL